MDVSFFFVIEKSLLAFVVFVGSVDEGVECVVEVLVLHRLPHLLHHDQELLSNHVVDPQTQNGNSLIGLLQNLLLSLHCMSQQLVLFLACLDLVHECVLTVDQLNSLLEAGIVVLIDLLLETDFHDASECLGLSLVVGVGTYLVDGLDGTDFSNVVVFIFGLLGDFFMDKLELLFWMSVELPFLDLFDEVSPEDSVNNAQGGLLV